MPDLADNPLLQPWNTQFGLPPFDLVRPEHFVPAFDAALSEHDEEIRAIAASKDAPTFDNTVAALDRSGRTLTRIEMLFGNLTASETSPALQAVEREMMPRLAAHHNAIHLDAELFARIDAIHRQRGSLALVPEQLSLLERVHLDFVRAGAKLEPKARKRLHAIVEELAGLHTQFSQNLLADESEFELVLSDEADLAGLPEQTRAAAKSAAEARGHADAMVITLSRSLVVPFLTHSERRDLREVAFNAWTRRGGNDGPHDNRGIARAILALRNEQARLHGFTNFADYALVDRMAGTPAAVEKLLSQVWAPARRKVLADRDALRAMAKECGQKEPLEPWDWRYYAEKVRKERYDFDDALVKPYFSLERMLAAAFDCANRLFGLSFVERPDLHAYHPDVRIFEVYDQDDALRAIFLSDNFARPTKRSGAWMSLYRFQSRIDGDVIPIVVNNNNFAKAPAGQPTLLSADDVRTLFHEFGHGLHGMLSQVNFERLSGTRVLRDFVELPSQLFEHWAEERDVLKRHARHCRTDAPIPDALLDKLRASQLANQGFETVEYVASAMYDMSIHALTDPEGADIVAFEKAEMERIGMPREIPMRHRPPHFGHLFSSAAYAAGYYVYIWAEVLDADGYDAFVEAGDPFDPDVAARLLQYVYSSGGTLKPADAYRAFRGRDPSVEPLLIQRGLVERSEALTAATK